MLTFLTLGPEGSNHDFVLRRYLAAHGLFERASIGYIEDFHDAARRVMAGEADFVLQCAVHPSTPEITARYHKTLFPVDAFVSPSQPMALLRSLKPSAADDTVAVQPATEQYTDLSHWSRRIFEPTVAQVGEGLLTGRYAAGIAFFGACPGASWMPGGCSADRSGLRRLGGLWGDPQQPR